MALFVISAFSMAGSMHFQTPILPEFGRTFGVDRATVGWVATLSFGGFFTGVVLLTPLGDAVDKRKLILAKLVGLIIAQLVMGLAPSFAVLLVGAFVTGVCAAVSQDIVPMVSGLAPARERGRVVGTVLSGLFLGILFGRLGGGIMAAQFGWRAVYFLSVVMLLPMLVALVLKLPAAPVVARIRYAKLMRSLVHLVRDNAEVRRAAATQFLLGIGYGGFWATLAPMAAALHGLGPAAAGLFGIPGAAGVLVARPAGRWMDRSGVRPVVATGVVLVLAAFASFTFAASTLVAVAIGAILLDSGLRAAMVANQTLVTGADPAARSRGITILAAHVWGGNAAGAFIATTAFAKFGWMGVCASGGSAALLALLAQRRGRRR